MPMILELTEDFVMQEYHEQGKLIAPMFMHKGLRGIVKEAGYSPGFPGIDDGAPIAVIQIINDDAEFQFVIVPLSVVKIAHDHAVVCKRTTTRVPR